MTGCADCYYDSQSISVWFTKNEEPLFGQDLNWIKIFPSPLPHIAVVFAPRFFLHIIFRSLQIYPMSEIMKDLDLTCVCVCVLIAARCAFSTRALYF